ncbi:MAG TPA: aminomethyl-transferring glycine dehydrogenase subunit GcvPA [Magnetospirillaceae bacterium]|nr:aminomethyl-transferring glycine dehydrogenase subunit GcvPA [Magnetospirillaceae bacterium]
MPYLPNTDSDRREMLQVIGRPSVESLFGDIPERLRYPRIDLPPPLSELEMLREIESLAGRNLSASSCSWFLGAGAYNHFIPSIVPALASRGEFLSAYTPYQPEVSQGTLQAIFEYQSMACALFGVEAMNASHYDGATALAEAVLMALRTASGRDSVVLPTALHPEYRAVIQTYLEPLAVKVLEYSGSPSEGAAALDDSAACLVAAYPDFEGRVHDLAGVADSVHAAGAVLVVHADPILLGLFRSPGSLGADIVTAEGQALGNAMNYGGPFLGMMGAASKLVRKMPGRIAGEARDAEGRRGFVLTLSAREQHIRREKAVSNICSNQGLVMLQACIYLAALGKNGLAKVAELCWHKAHYAAARIAELPGYSVEGDTFFKEFVVRTPAPAQAIYERLSRNCVVPGLPLSRYWKDRSHELLVCVTEMNTKAQIDLLVDSLKEAATCI